MISRYFSMIGFILFALSPHLTRAEPSSCDYRLHYLEWTQKYFDSADAVFLGTVVNEETPDPPARPAISTEPAGNMDELLERIQAAQSLGPSPDRLQRATFRIQKSWTNLVGPKIDVAANLYTDDTSSHALLRAGDTYLVFAYKSDDQVTLRVPVGCASHLSLKDTASKIRVLDALTKKPGSH